MIVISSVKAQALLDAEIALRKSLRKKAQTLLRGHQLLASTEPGSLPDAAIRGAMRDVFHACLDYGLTDSVDETCEFLVVAVIVAGAEMT